MTGLQFQSLSADLRTIAPQIPIKWGHVQNNKYDNELKKVCNIFNVMSLAELNQYISTFDEDHCAYYKRRWYLLRCADCDEYLFYKNDNVEHNPVRYDKEWDIKINNHIKFDVKGTVIPRDFRGDYESVLQNPEQIIQFYYDKQSQGVRYDMQNRLFVAHHSLVDANREFYLRCAWGTKDKVYRKFVENAEHIHFYTYEGCTAAVIFIIETQRNVLQSKISGLDDNLTLV